MFDARRDLAVALRTPTDGQRAFDRNAGIRHDIAAVGAAAHVPRVVLVQQILHRDCSQRLRRHLIAGVEADQAVAPRRIEDWNDGTGIARHRRYLIERLCRHVRPAHCEVQFPVKETRTEQQTDLIGRNGCERRTGTARRIGRGGAGRQQRRVARDAPASDVLTRNAGKPRARIIVGFELEPIDAGVADILILIAQAVAEW